MNKLFLLLLLLNINMLFSQKKKASLEEKIQFVIEHQFDNYKDLNKNLKSFKRDTMQLKKMVSIFKKKHFLYGLTYAENNLGIRYRNYSLYKKAIATHKNALENAKKAHSIEFQVFSLNMLGVVYRRMVANRTALDYSQEALELADNIKNPNEGILRGIAIAHNSMGNIYLLLKQYDLAIQQFEKSQVIEKSIHNELGLAINYQNVGNVLEAQGKIDEALAHYQKSLNINRKRKNKLGLVICNSSIANIYIQQGKLQKALTLIQVNLPIIEKMGNKYYHAYELLDLGWAQTKLSQFNNAKKNLLKGLSMAKEYNLTSAISTAYNNLSELYELKSNFKDALKYQKLSEEFENKIINERNLQYVNDLIIKYDSERKNSQIESLAKQNEISQLQLSKNRNLLIASMLFLFFSSVIVYVIYKNQNLNYEKEKVKLEQTALRSQMNPHFIFNSLNSIKLYIIESDKENAVYYLNKFSKLIRKILGATKEKETVLAEEIETMKLYLNIENIRFENAIKSEFTVDKTLNVNTIKVPSLILQPFIENAIWHGLSSKKGEKKIKITFKKENNSFLTISIEDNGVGRKRSNDIKGKKIHKRESIGIKLTEDRLENFAKTLKKDYQITFVDLYDTNKKPIGTKVVLKIPTE